jgi:hypothetical protein
MRMKEWSCTRPHQRCQQQQPPHRYRHCHQKQHGQQRLQQLPPPSLQQPSAPLHDCLASLLAQKASASMHHARRHGYTDPAGECTRRCLHTQTRESRRFYVARPEPMAGRGSERQQTREKLTVRCNVSIRIHERHVGTWQQTGTEQRGALGRTSVKLDRDRVGKGHWNWRARECAQGRQHSQSEYRIKN